MVAVLLFVTASGGLPGVGGGGPPSVRRRRPIWVLWPRPPRLPQGVAAACARATAVAHGMRVRDAGCQVDGLDVVVTAEVDVTFAWCCAGLRKGGAGRQSIVVRSAWLRRGRLRLPVVPVLAEQQPAGAAGAGLARGGCQSRRYRRCRRRRSARRCRRSRRCRRCRDADSAGAAVTAVTAQPRLCRRPRRRRRWRRSVGAAPPAPPAPPEPKRRPALPPAPPRRRRSATAGAAVPAGAAGAAGAEEQAAVAAGPAGPAGA